MDGTMYIADDGTVQVPLAGPVHVAGLSPTEAAHAVEAALREKQILVSPHVSFTILKSTSQQVSVLGEVRNPGIFPIQSNSTLLELLARAGGETEQGADTIFVLRPSPGGAMQRLPVNLQGLADDGTPPEAAEFTMKGGDQVYVPRAPQVFVTGEVRTAGRFRIDPGMTVLEALARAGGVTNMGSTRRISVKREEGGGRYREFSAKLTDKVKPNDVITVRERIF
jgi:polysaccharide export outer membrane protein